MKLSQERVVHTERYLKQVLKKQARAYEHRIGELRDHFSLPTSDRTKAILRTHREYLEAMAGTIIDAYRAAFLQEELALDENDISEIISRTSFHLHEKLNNCVKRLQMNLVMSGETEGIVNDILNDANEGLHVYVSAMQLTSKEDVQGTSEPTFSFVADKT